LISPAKPYAEVMSGGQPEPSGLTCADSLKASKGQEMTAVIKQQDQIEVFVNEAGSITLKQTNPLGEEQIIVFWREHSGRICDAIDAAARDAEIDEIQGRGE